MRRLIPLLLVWLLLLSSVAHGSLGFDPGMYGHELAGKHFILFYDTEGENAVTPKYAAEVLAHAERAYRRLVEDGGLRPPRVEPVPIELRAREPYYGGSVRYRDYGLDLVMAINPNMHEGFALGDVVAHELFHVLQGSYQKQESHSIWAVEGTAPLASLYTYPRDHAVTEGAFRNHLSQYYRAQGHSMKEEPYLSSLFWFWVAEQYGGVKYLARLMHWSEHVEWERAAQLAALEGGAPPETTFDTLWRSFMLALVDGRMPSGYKTNGWFAPKELTWLGSATSLTRGDLQSGLGPLGHRYLYYEPLTLGAYAFEVVEIRHQSPMPVELTVEGDSGALEAYVIKPGSMLHEALKDYSKRPRYQNLAAPPSDPATRGAPVAVGSPVRLEGEYGDRSLVLLLRLGNWGHSSFAVSLKPASAGGKAQPPAWSKLTAIEHPADSAGSPPPLTAAELADLKAKRYLNGLASLQVDQVERIDFVRIRLTAGDTTMRKGRETIALPVVVQQDKAGKVWFPAKPLTLALGGRVEGNRFYFGEEWVEADPASGRVTASSYQSPPYPVVKVIDGELMASWDLFYMGGVGIRVYGDVWEFTFPDPEPR